MSRSPSSALSSFSQLPKANLLTFWLSCVGPYLVIAPKGEPFSPRSFGQLSFSVSSCGPVGFWEGNLRTSANGLLAWVGPGSIADIVAQHDGKDFNPGGLLYPKGPVPFLTPFFFGWEGSPTKLDEKVVPLFYPLKSGGPHMGM